MDGYSLSINPQDLATITSCLKVINGEITPSELSKFCATLVSTPKELCSTALDIDLSDYEIIPSREQQQILTLLNKLSQTVGHGKNLVNKIFLCYRLSVNLDSTFKVLLIFGIYYRKCLLIID